MRSAVWRTLYRVQYAYVAATIGDDACAGYKIGLTSKRMQQMCGIDQPIAGTIYSRKVFKSGARLSMADYGRLGLEFEICVRLGRDLDAGSEPFTPEQGAKPSMQLPRRANSSTTAK
jgi:2-keto-4-pentenoate hydratase